LVADRSESIIYRYDEGVEEARYAQAMAAYDRANREAKELDDIGYPLTAEELQAAHKRLEDRKWRMKYGVRRMDLRTICPRCRASIFSDSIYCSRCGEIVGQKPQIIAFICHGAKDSDWCKKLVDALKRQNVQAWIDIEQLTPGDSLQESISREISECDVFIFVASRDSLYRPWPREELRAAITRRLDSQKAKPFTLIPALIDDCADQLPRMLKDTVYQKFYKDGKPLPFESEEGRAALKGILKGIAKHASKSIEDKHEHLSVKDLNSLIREKTIDLNSKDQFPFKACPKCGSKNLTREPAFDVGCDVGDDGEPDYYKFDIPAIQCPKCGWSRTEQDIDIGLLP